MEQSISPFHYGDEIKTMLMHDLKNLKHEIVDDEISKTLKWLCTCPSITTIRINPAHTTVQESIKIIVKHLNTWILKNNLQQRPLPNVYQHPVITDVIVVESWSPNTLEIKRKEKEVIVDVYCGAALLRGAQIYAPGVIGMQSGTNIGDIVSVYSDTSGKCKKGFAKLYEDCNKIFIGNGIVHLNRHHLFSENVKQTGIAVEMLDVVSGCPSIQNSILPSGHILLQNLPSVVCGHVLNPKPSDVVLDMCAAPGNKTTHLATLMNNQGTLIALEKNKSKIEQLKEVCKQFSATCVKVFNFDSTKAIDFHSDRHERENVLNGPPFSPNVFDKILLDAPCSALGQRPQLKNKITPKMLNSYVPQQRKLFKTAFELLKLGGILVYSTCTITTCENEGIVQWALKTFPNLKLIPTNPQLGGPGYFDSNFDQQYCDYVQRFGPPSEGQVGNNNYCDSIGFFIASFRKESY